MNNLRRILISKHQKKSCWYLQIISHQLYRLKPACPLPKKMIHVVLYMFSKHHLFRRVRCLVLGRWSLLGFQHSSWAPLLCLRGSLRCNRWSLQCLPQDGPPLKTEELTTRCWFWYIWIYLTHHVLRKVAPLSSIFHQHVYWDHRLNKPH